MKKLKLKEAMRFFPLTVQKSGIVNRRMPKQVVLLRAKGYQNDQVNSQQHYKPISKILHFQ